MKKNLTLLLFLTLIGGCSSHFTLNGLICPVDDQAIIQRDLANCHIYDMDAIDKSLRNENCKSCIEAKGYRVDPDAKQQ